MEKALQHQVESALNDQILSASPVVGGTINQTFMLELQRTGSAILRVAPSARETSYPGWFSPFGLRREQAAFALLENLLGSYLPRTLAFSPSSNPDHGDWIVQTLVPGVPASTVVFKWDRANQLAFWEAYGTLVRKMHSVAGSWFGPVSDGEQFQSWTDLVRHDAQQFSIDLAGNTFEPAPERTILPALDDDFSTIEPVLIHSDLGLHHVMVDPASCEITGVIDFEYARFSDPIAESALWTVLKLPELEHHQAFLKGYGPITASDNRMKVAGLLGYYWDVTNRERLARATSG